MKIPLCVPAIDDDEIAAVNAVLRSGWLAHGPKGEEFEKQVASLVGTKHALAVNSCASALQLALLAHGVSGEVIVPSFTFAASANAIVNAGATPVFADVDYDTGNVTAAEIEKKITGKTSAIMPVHFAGQTCRMDDIMKLAQERNLAVIEDSAECLGGTFKGAQAGSFGTGCFSFYPTKNITTGEGGMVTTDDDEIAQKVKTLRAHGISSSTYERERAQKPWLRSALAAGYNFRMSDILAALGTVQMKKLGKLNELRREHAAYLTAQLSGIEGVQTPVEDRDCTHTYQMYTIKVPASTRTQFLASLREDGVGASVHFEPPVHQQERYKTGESLPVTEKLSASIVTLPLYPGLSREQLDYMISAVEKAASAGRSGQEA